ncbi:MAG: signal peptide peptidase SppA [Verrucomicrobia bacterium]|jgi:protease-4|nr:signal peptide peptidase SppA [Verrucomicrobiota bacterium]
MVKFLLTVLRMLLALVSAAVLFAILLFFFVLGLGLILSPEPEKPQKDAILVLDLNFNLTEKPTAAGRQQLAEALLEGEMLRSVSLLDLQRNLEEASKDKQIAGLLLRGNLIPEGYGSRYAALRDLRDSIRRFASRKPVWAYLEGDNLRDLYVKSAADEVIVNPESFVDFRGLAAEGLYLGDTLEKAGIGVQTVRREEYKSAADAFSRAEMSPEEREQVRAYLDDLWNTLAGDVAGDGGAAIEKLNGIAESNLFLIGEDVVEAGIADKSLYYDELVDYLSEKGFYDADRNSFGQFSYFSYASMNLRKPVDFLPGGSGNQVAVLYAEGPIVDGEGDENNVGSGPMVRYLREMRKESSCKAVVLRINSPGGSATASERIAREVRLTNQVKPVVVSMGGLAASGGYMIAAHGEEIFAQPSTLTGSIGVVVMFLNFEDLADKLAIGVDSVETHPFADSFSVTRPKSEREMEHIASLADRFYDGFLGIVAEGREMELAEVRKLAKGRIWSGKAALGNGLVDREGGLQEAIKRAADLAGIGDDYEIVERPRPKTLEEEIAEIFMEARGVRPMKVAPGDMWRRLEGDFRTEWERFQSFNDPNGLYGILPYTLHIR